MREAKPEELLDLLVYLEDSGEVDDTEAARNVIDGARIIAVDDDIEGVLLIVMWDTMSEYTEVYKWDEQKEIHRVITENEISAVKNGEAEEIYR